MKTYRLSEHSQAEVNSLKARPRIDFSSIFSKVHPTVEDVRSRGGAAVKDYTARFDKVELDKIVENVSELPDPQFDAAIREAFDVAYDNIYAFHAAQKSVGRTVENKKGVKCKRVARSIASVGLYVPGGTAVLPSTALMLSVTAQIAGCKTVMVATPPAQDGSICKSMSRPYENDLLLANQLIKQMEETVRYDDETSALIRECIDSLDNALALPRKNICSTICFSDHQTFWCPLCDYVNTNRSGAKRHNSCKNCGTYWIKDDAPVARGYGKTKGYKSKESSKVAKNRKPNNENSSLIMAATTAEVASAITSTVPGIRHSLKATKAKLGNSSSNSSSAPYQEWKSGYRLTLTPDQDGTEHVFRIGDESSDGSHLQSGADATEMSTQHLVEREDMEMLADRQASSCQTAVSSTNSAGQVTLFSRVKAVARWPSVLFNRARSYFTERSDQEGATSLQPNGSSLDLEAGNGTEIPTTPPISDGSSQDPEEGNVTDEIPQNHQSNHSPKHFGMFIFFFAVNLVLAHVRDTYNDTSSSTKANWHSYYFGATITISFISTLCANILAKYEKAARILEKIGIGFGASGFIMAMVELLLPNMTWIAWIATPIVWIAVILS